MRLQDHPAVQRRDFFLIDPRELQVDESYNARDMKSADTKAHIADLKRSIVANGVKTPLEIRVDGNSIFVVAGHCRHAAVMQAIEGGAEIVAVPCIPEAKGTSPEDRVVNLITSNSGKPLNALEVGNAVKRLKAYGWADKTIAEKLGWKTTGSVKQALEIAGFGEPIKDHVREGNISATAARHLAKSDLSQAEQEELIRANLEENKKIKGKKTRVTPKQIKRATAPKEPASALPTSQQPAARVELPPAPAMISPPPEQAPLSPDPESSLPPVQTMTDAELEDGLVKAGYLQAPDQSLLDKTRSQVEQSNGWHPDRDGADIQGVGYAMPTRQALDAYFAAVTPIASAIADYNLDEIDDDDMVSITIIGKDAKRFSLVHRQATGGAE